MDDKPQYAYAPASASSLTKPEDQHDLKGVRSLDDDAKATPTIVAVTQADTMPSLGMDPIKALSFPAKLHAILSRKDLSPIIGWMPHGRAWRVHQPKMFELHVVPEFFVRCKYSSFIRQANGWGFQRISQGPDRNAYYHEYFMRGKLQLCQHMRRVSAKRKTPPGAVDDYPDFYKMDPLPESTVGDMKGEMKSSAAAASAATMSVVTRRTMVRRMAAEREQEQEQRSNVLPASALGIAHSAASSMATDAGASNLARLFANDVATDRHQAKAQAPAYDSSAVDLPFSGLLQRAGHLHHYSAAESASSSSDRRSDVGGGGGPRSSFLKEGGPSPLLLQVLEDRDVHRRLADQHRRLADRHSIAANRPVVSDDHVIDSTNGFRLLNELPMANTRGSLLADEQAIARRSLLTDERAITGRSLLADEQAIAGIRRSLLGGEIVPPSSFGYDVNPQRSLQGGMATSFSAEPSIFSQASYGSALVPPAEQPSLDNFSLSGLLKDPAGRTSSAAAGGGALLGSSSLATAPPVAMSASSLLSGRMDELIEQRRTELEIRAFLDSQKQGHSR